MINTERGLFLELLGSAIWDKDPDPSAFHNLDKSNWENIFKEALKQRVSALVIDAVQKLPKELQPCRDIFLKQMIYSEFIKSENLRINRVLSDISAIYREMGLSFIILKGQVNAQYYPNPLHRVPGDIDIFIYKTEDYKKAMLWVTEQNFSKEDKCINHEGFFWQNTEIENHHTLAVMANPLYNKKFQKQVSNYIAVGQFRTIKIDELLHVTALPDTLNGIYIFLHLFNHFLDGGGIGIRQICDWLLFLSNNRENIDKELFTTQSKQLKLLSPMIFTAMATIKYMGASPDIFPFPLNQKYSKESDTIMNDILEGGNFGFYSKARISRPKGRWSGRLHSFKNSIARNLYFRTIAPQHTLLLPIYKIVRRLQLLFMGVK